MSKGLWRDCVTRAIIRKRRSRFCSSTNPSWIRPLTTLQLRNALTEVFLPSESAQVGLGYMKPEIIGKNRKGRPTSISTSAARSTAKEVIHQPIYPAINNINRSARSPTVPPLIDGRGQSPEFLPAARGPLSRSKTFRVEIHAGNFVSIVGPSGCGKSTLLKIISGSAAGVVGNGCDQAANRCTGPLANVGMVFQAPVLLKWRSVLGNILLPVEFAKLDIAKLHRQSAAR